MLDQKHSYEGHIQHLKDEIMRLEVSKIQEMPYEMLNNEIKNLRGELNMVFSQSSCSARKVERHRTNSNIELLFEVEREKFKIQIDQMQKE